MTKGYSNIFKQHIAWHNKIQHKTSFRTQQSHAPQVVFRKSPTPRPRKMIASVDRGQWFASILHSTRYRWTFSEDHQSFVLMVLFESFSERISNVDGVVSFDSYFGHVFVPLGGRTSLSLPCLSCSNVLIQACT